LEIASDWRLPEEDSRHFFAPGEAAAAIGVSLVSLGYLTCRRNYHCCKRVRNDYLLLLTLSGEAWVEEGRRRRNLAANSWFLLRPGVAHSYCDHTPWDFIYVHFGGPAAERVLAELAFFKRENLGFQQRNHTAQQLLGRLLHYAGDASAAAEVARAALLLELLAALQMNFRSGPDREDPLTAVHDYIAARPERNFELDELARIAGISRYHFSRRFKEKYGYPPVRYAQKLRIEQAKLLLRTEPDPRRIRDIAAACGFRDPLHFSRTFKQWTGMSPEAFRAYVRHWAPA